MTEDSATAKGAPPPATVKVRRARRADIPKIYACQEAAYGGPRSAGLCDERTLTMQLEAFPEGQLVATLRGKVVGYAASLIVTLGEESPWYSYNEITGAGTFTTHDPAGDTLYGADIGVHPKYRGRGISGLLYEARKHLVERLNLRRMVAGGRIPGFKEHAGRLSAEEYVAKVQAGELKDQALNAHLKAGYKVRGVHIGYLRDTESLDYATFLEYENQGYRPSRRRIAAAPLTRPIRRMRVTAAQYRMRAI
ncbi:MAG: GNAT family N-acetyltransferase, partial [Myxococcales bacterium]|nr:GNAT family N-acetyltransferase [Myxococcales bacterium]